MKVVSLITMGVAMLLLALAIDLLLKFGGFWAWALFVIAFIAYCAPYTFKLMHVWLAD